MPQQNPFYEIAVLVMALPSPSGCLSAPAATRPSEPDVMHGQRGSIRRSTVAQQARNSHLSP